MAATKMKTKPTTKAKPTPAAGLRVTGDLVDACEAIARRRRQSTGATDVWSQVAREAMAIGLAQLGPPAGRRSRGV